MQVGSDGEGEHLPQRLDHAVGYGPTAILGGFTGPGKKSVLAVGDSIQQGTGDNLTALVTGTGPIAHASPNSGVKSGVIPFVNLGRSNGRVSYFNVTPQVEAYLQYANVLLDNYGINSSAAGAASAYNDNATLWAEARAQGVQKIVRLPLTPNTTSTDG